MSQSVSRPSQTVRTLPPLDPVGYPTPVAALTESVRSAVSALRAYKLRSFLTMLGIVVGVAALLLIVDLGQVTQDYVASQWSHVGANLVSIGLKVQPGMSKGDAMAHSPLTGQDVQALQRLPHVTAASPAGYDGTSVVVGSYSGMWPIEAGYPSIQTLQNLVLQNGTFFSDQDEAAGAAMAVVGPGVVEHVFRGANPVGLEMRLGTVNFRVVGVVSRQGAAPGTSDVEDTIFVPFSTYQQRLAGHNATQIMLQVDQIANVPSVMTAVTQTLDQQHHIAYDQPSDFIVWYNSASSDPQVQQLNLARSVMTIVAVIALLIGGFGVGSTMFMAVRQRTSEIGLRIAVGAQPADVLRQFLTEAAALTAIGGVLGAAVGSILAFAFYLEYHDKLFGHWFRAAVQNHPLPAPAAILAAVAVSILIGVAFGYLPARHAAQLDPIIALRDE